MSTEQPQPDPADEDRRTGSTETPASQSAPNADTSPGDDEILAPTDD